MSVGERIREIRKQLDLTQTAFGERIALKQAIIGQIENGSRALTDRSALQICQSFNVNETWLRTGDGSMFIDDDDDNTIVAQLVQRYHFKPMEKKLLETYLSLPDEYREGVLRYAEALVASVLADAGQTAIEEDAAREAEAYRLEYIAEKRRQTSPASTDGNESTAG